MRKIEAVIFDWAGTTVDYGCFAPVQAFVEAFGKQGICPTIDEVRAPMGIAKIEHVQAMLNMERIGNEWRRLKGREYTREDVLEIYQDSEKMILDILKDFSAPKPYVVETVRNLKDKGIKIGSTTGYNDEMMQIVVPKAAELGYVPDSWVSPDAVGKVGRPYPYMIFENMKRLNVKSVNGVLKVGDTEADILEGKHAGVLTVGILEGSSLMGLSEQEYSLCPEAEKILLKEKVKQRYKDCGADYIIDHMGQLEQLVEELEGRCADE